MSDPVPLLVYGPLSATYDFGPAHPLTPRRFAPSIDLLGTVGAEPGLAPEPVPDPDLLACHAREYVEVVREFSETPSGRPRLGVGTPDDPAFPGMHAAASMVAGGSIRAMDAILRGDVGHAFHPGGGLHHAMRSAASGFCIYNDVALAIARARAAGLRVLYVDLDVHHGDGVQAIHDADPGVMTVSIHESGRSLFPGTGFLDEAGDGIAVGTKVNIPLQASTGATAWLSAIETVLPELAASFGPDIVVSQHGADSHALDPLAHIRNTTTSMGAAARLVDAIAHRWAGGRWLATGGGGYDAYRVVPRSWSLVWLAGAHREVPSRISPEWRERWSAEAARYGQVPLPETFDDPENAGIPVDGSQQVADRAAAEMTIRVRQLHVPALVRVAADLGWWDARTEVARPAGDVWTTRAGAEVGAHMTTRAGRDRTGDVTAASSPTIVASVDAATWGMLRLAARVVAPADPPDAHALILAGLLGGEGSPVISAAVVGDVVVGLVVSAVPPLTSVDAAAGPRHLLAVGVAPTHRGAGLGREILRAHIAALATVGDGRPVHAAVTFAERDPVAPIGRDARAIVARHLLAAAGFELGRVPAWLSAGDPAALVATLPAPAR